MSAGRFLHRCRRFGRETDAGVSIEYVLWIPILLGAFVFIADIAVALTLNATMWHSSRDTSRALSLHQITETEAVRYLQDRLMFPSRDYDIDVTMNKRQVRITVSIPFSDAGATGAMSRLIEGNLVAQVTMLREPV